jgi:UDP-glucose 4-epimerase
VRWDDPTTAKADLREAVLQFLGSDPAPCDDGRRAICWTAGAGVVGTPAPRLQLERDALRVVLEAAAQTNVKPPERFFLASSAGGLHAGTKAVFVDEWTPPAPTSAYGESKLRQEEVVRSWADSLGVDVLMGRISNLYGPGQKLSKPQGFISHLFSAMVERRTFTFTVPGNTIRDFVFTDDVAARIARWLGSPAAPAPVVGVKLLVSGQSVTLAKVARLAGRIARVPVKVLLAQAPGSLQPGSIRFRSIERIDLDQGAYRSLECGLHATWTFMLQTTSGMRCNSSRQP